MNRYTNNKYTDYVNNYYKDDDNYNYYNDDNYNYNNSGIINYDADIYNFIIISLLLFSCCCLLKCISERCSNYINYRRNRVDTPRLKYINYNNENKYDICTICLEINDNKSTQLECGHIYHKKCIKEWIKTTRNQNLEINCPLCKVNII